MKSVYAVLLMSLLALASGRTVARGAAGQQAKSMPSRYMMWQTQDKQPAQTQKANKKDEEKMPIVKRLQKLLIVDVNQLPERWMALA